MDQGHTPPPGWWRAADGNYYAPEQLPPGWVVDATGNARPADAPPVIPPTTVVPALALEPADANPGRASRALRTYRGWPMWAKVLTPILALGAMGGIIDAADGSGAPPTKVLGKVESSTTTSSPASTTTPGSTSTRPSTTLAPTTTVRATTTIAPPTTAAPSTTAARAALVPATPSSTAPPATAPPATRAPVTAPPTTAPPATAPPTTAGPRQGVTSGAFCSPAGALGVTSTGLPMVCTTTPTDSRNRWRAV